MFLVTLYTPKQMAAVAQKKTGGSTAQVERAHR